MNEYNPSSFSNIFCLKEIYGTSSFSNTLLNFQVPYFWRTIMLNISECCQPIISRSLISKKNNHGYV